MVKNQAHTISQANFPFFLLLGCELNDQELKEFSQDTQYLCQEIGKFLNKWKGKLFLPLEKSLETLEIWLGSKKELRK